MPRPTVINAKRQPVPPLNLEEVRFWLRILEEHALFIKAGLPGDNPGLINEADTFQQGLAGLQAQAEGVLSERRFAELVAESRVLVGEFYFYNRRLVHLALTCQIFGINFALFLDHLSREAEYVLQLLDKLGIGQIPLYQVSSAREAVFWIRLMADHAELIVHWLDPSERNLVETAAGLAGEFDELYLQGRDFVSMLRGETEEIPSFRRFLQDVRVSTARLRDFKRAAEVLIGECKLVGLMPALVADHVRREADHFLLLLAILEKESYVPFDDCSELEYINLETKQFNLPPIAEPQPFVPPPVQIVKAASQPEFYVGDGDEEDDDEEHNFPAREPAFSREPMPVSQPVLADPKPAEPNKYKWSGKWPRPLGKL